ncbi:MAG: proline dehydrogenase family protein [Bacteroidales bacterium]|nr:proline dehydrogenase family protein [Bacteroidales bacterium]
MSDPITARLAKEGFNVAKYVPYGPVKEVLPYLSRRAIENTSVKGQTGRELQQIKSELARRKAIGALKK